MILRIALLVAFAGSAVAGEQADAPVSLDIGPTGVTYTVVIEPRLEIEVGASSQTITVRLGETFEVDGVHYRLESIDLRRAKFNITNLDAKGKYRTLMVHMGPQVKQKTLQQSAAPLPPTPRTGPSEGKYSRSDVNPFRALREDDVRSIVISSHVCISKLSDNPTADPFSTGKPARVYFVDTIYDLNPRLRITSHDLIRKLFVLASSVAADTNRAVPASGFWSAISFEDAKGKVLAEMALSPAASLVQMQLPSDTKVVATGQAEELSRFVYNLLKEHAPDALTIWDQEEGLKEELFKDKRTRQPMPDGNGLKPTL